MLESLLSNRTVSVLWEALPRILSAGLTMTIPLTLVSFTLAMVLAVAVALVQYARVPVLSQLARFYIWVIRGTPLLVQLFIIFYGLPSVGIMLDAFPAAVIAFAFNEGAYCAETMRGALISDHLCLRVSLCSIGSCNIVPFGNHSLIDSCLIIIRQIQPFCFKFDQLDSVLLHVISYSIHHLFR